MSAEDLVKAGDLAGALSELQGRVRIHPGDLKLRIFLFQLMAVLGQWKRALIQLDVIHQLDSEVWPLVHTYREVINCEMHREAVFQGRCKPIIFGEPQQWMAVLVEAQQAHAQGDMARFLKLNAQALEQAPPSAGQINKQPFEWLADADRRFGPMLEMIFNGQYYWVPLTVVRALRTEKPADIRDLVWLPAEVTWANEGQNMVMIPARYPLSPDLGSENLLSRKTDWRDRGEGVFDGLGQRMLVTDQSDYPVLEVRSIEMSQ
jgi:type VI secretion system protein ImpE